MYGVGIGPELLKFSPFLKVGSKLLDALMKGRDKLPKVIGKRSKRY